MSKQVGLLRHDVPGGLRREVHRRLTLGIGFCEVREPVETLSGDPSLELSEFDAPPDEPLLLLESWLQGADARGVREPRALALATADAGGRPSNRIVLLKRASPSIVFAFSANSRSVNALSFMREKRNAYSAIVPCGKSTKVESACRP